MLVAVPRSAVFIINYLIKDYLGGSVSELYNIEHSAKLTALKQLLTDLGIQGETGTTGEVTYPYPYPPPPPKKK